MNDKERQIKLRGALPAIRAHYKELAAKTLRMGDLILEMMRHPDTPPKMVLEAHKGYARTYASYLEMRDSLRKLYPQQHSGFLAKYPWDK
jgi:hypothetical protein